MLSNAGSEANQGEPTDDGGGSIVDARARAGCQCVGDYCDGSKGKGEIKSRVGRVRALSEVPPRSGRTTRKCGAERLSLDLAFKQHLLTP